MLAGPRPFTAWVTSRRASSAAGPPPFSTSESPPAAAGSPSLHGPHCPAVSAASQFAIRRDSPSGQVSGPIGRIAPAPRAPPTVARDSREMTALWQAAASIQLPW